MKYIRDCASASDLQESYLSVSVVHDNCVLVVFVVVFRSVTVVHLGQENELDRGIRDWRDCTAGIIFLQEQKEDVHHSIITDLQNGKNISTYLYIKIF